MIDRLRRVLIATAAALACALALRAQTPAPAAPQPPPFFFLQFSDPQFGMFTADKEFSQETLNFELAIATANRLKPAFVVITGDLVNRAGNAAQIAEYHRIARKLDRRIPLHAIPGNHDVENEPTPASVAAYVKRFGRDYYSFRAGDIFGIILNSSLIHSPGGAPALAAAQETWLKAELARARASGAKHIVVFQHHPWFLKDATEADGYFNIPLVRREPLLALFRANGVKLLVSGHYHRNAVASSGDLQMVTTAPVGMPLGEGTQSGIRVFIVGAAGITHRFYALGELPPRIE